MPENPRHARIHKLDIAALLGLAALWAAIILIVDPRGDFALNDSWSYAQPVRSLLDKGEIRLTPWTAMPLLGQVAWGALFSAIFGFSFETLRASTLVLGLTGVWTVYGMLREMHVGRGVATGGAALVALNPLYINLAHTFMTDVPFAAALACSMWLAIRGFRSKGEGRVWASITLLLFATMIRQAGLVLGIALGPAWWLARGGGARRSWRLFAPPALCIAALACHRLWFTATGQPVSHHNPLGDTLSAFQAGPAKSIIQTMRHAWSLALFCGVLVSPMIVAMASKAFGALRNRRWRMTGVVASTVCLILAVLRPKFPDGVPNILFNLGVGPLTLRDTALLHLAHWPALPGWLWLPVNAIGGASIGLLAVLSAKASIDLIRLCDDKRGPGFTLCLLFVVLYGLAVSIQPHIFDRYMLPFIPALLVLGLTAIKGSVSTNLGIGKIAFGLGVLAGLALGVYGALGTRDYFAWNRARVVAIDWLVDVEGATSAEMDAGFEFSLSNLLDIDFYPPPRLSWWWVRDDRYLLVFDRTPGEFADYEQIAEFGYKQTMPPGHGAVLALERNN